MTGIVKRLMQEKGYFFVRDENGREYFGHRSEVLRDGFKELREGDRVSFDESSSAKGPRATNIVRM